MSYQPWFLAAVCLLATACAPAESKNTNDPAEPLIGVVQCDEYLAQVTACINSRIPQERRAGLHAEVRQTFTSWKEATTASERAALPQACAIAQEQAKEEYAAYGCAM